MSRKLCFTVIFVLASLVLLFICKTRSLKPVFADTVDDLQAQIDQLQHLKDLSAAATTPLEGTVADLETRIKTAQAGITAAKNQEDQVAAGITQRETDMVAQYQVFSARVADSYIRARTASPMLVLLSSQDASDLTKQLAYSDTLNAQDDTVIKDLGQEVTQLQTDKTNLEATQAKLASLQTQLDTQETFFQGEIKKAQDYQQSLSGQIAALSAQQQAILAEKSGTFQTSVGDVPLADDAASRPDYNPGFSPAFAAFSFGAPHFKGLSQYGAFGRAKSGQSVDDILHAYYGSGIEINKSFDTGRQICVGSSKSSCTSMDLETYTKRIYEMPSSWGDQGGMEALKAQAVAVRSYALYSMAANGYICPTESCQAYQPQDKGGHWDEAVDATRGWVLQANGQPFFAQYASSSGGYQDSYTYNGYSTPGFWDTNNGQAGWTAGAYEKIAGSPWFYKGWYRDRGGDSCGLSSPWLTAQQMADVINAWVVLIQHGQSDDRVTPIGSCWGGNPYSMDELRDKANSLGGGYSSVSGASVTYASNGVTASVTFQTDKGSVTINGLDFYKAFNLRAPGKISLKSGLFNIEHK